MAIEDAYSLTDTVEKVGLNGKAFRTLRKATSRKGGLDGFYIVENRTNVPFEKPRAAPLAKRSPEQGAQSWRRETDPETVFDRLIFPTTGSL